MGKGKINMCVEDWIHFQEHRLHKMSLIKVRVEIEEQQFYARLKIPKDHVVIFPDDDEIDPIIFEQRHIHGLIEVGNRGIQVNKRFQKPPIKIFLRTPAERDVVMEKFKSFISDESTSSSNSSPEGSNTTDPGPPN